MTTLRALVAAAVAALAVTVTAATAPSASRPEAAEGRIVAIADVHGAGGAFVRILQRTGLIDERQRWIGGTAILVQTGDLLDRGADVKPVFDLLMALEPQAASAGGRVQVLLGNHEGMNMLGETRDASVEAFRTFADDKSESRREQGFQAARKISKGAALEKDAWMAAHPPGYVEYRDAFAPNARYGKWLRTKPVVAEIDGTVFMHGGINPASAPDSLDAINKRARQELSDWDRGLKWLIQHDLALPFSTLQEAVEAANAEYSRLAARAKKEGTLSGDAEAAEAILPLLNIATSTFISADGPVWFRGYSTWTDDEGAPLMEGLLKKYKVKRFVTGHTPQPGGRITIRFNNTLYLIDTGMLNGKFYPNGRPSAVEIKGDVVTPIYAE
jgi:Calcineurin-like phosphoesterase